MAMPLKILAAGLLLLFFSSRNYGQQDYIKYYQLIHQAEKYHRQGAEKRAFAFYQEAFTQVDFIHSENLDKAAKLAKSLGFKHLAKNYLDMAGRQREAIDKELAKKIIALIREDQRVRASRYLKAKDFYEEAKKNPRISTRSLRFKKSELLVKEWEKVDSTNIARLLDIIHQHGYPGEKMVGLETNALVHVLLLHYDRDTANHLMGETLKKALLEGSMTPHQYATIIDRHLDIAGKPQQFFTIPYNFENLTPAERTAYNMNRKEIGLESLEGWKMIRRGNTVIVKKE